MALNPYFRFQGTEQNVVEDNIIEIIRMMGKNLWYIPRENVNLDRLFGEDQLNKFTKVISLSSTDIDMDFCDEEICTANKIMLIDMKNKRENSKSNITNYFDLRGKPYYLLFAAGSVSQGICILKKKLQKRNMTSLSLTAKFVLLCL
jgi:hypothetical protein